MHYFYVGTRAMKYNKTYIYIAFLLLFPPSSWSFAATNTNEPIPPIWKISASSGVAGATGNANFVTLTLGFLTSRTDAHNKFMIALDGAYGMNYFTELQDSNNNGVVDNDQEIKHSSKIAVANVLGKLRYDRLFNIKNALFIAAQVGHDTPASKKIFTDAQIGYGREIVKNKRHEFLGEAGLNVGYTRWNAPTPVPSAFVADSIALSARLFAGYNLTVNEHTLVFANIEALININRVSIADRQANFGQASKINSKIGINTQLWKSLSLRCSFLMRYDAMPGFNTQMKFSPAYSGRYRYNKQVDLMGELALVVSFL